MQHSSLVPHCITSLHLLTHAGTDHDADSTMHGGPRGPLVLPRPPEVKVSRAPQRTAGELKSQTNPTVTNESAKDLKVLRIPR